MTDPTLTVLVLLGLAAVAAGFVDAVVGGGGLIQLPGAAARAAARGADADPGDQQAGVDLRDDGELGDVLPPDQAGPADLPADDGARLRGLVLRRAVASQIPRSAFEPIVLVALVVVGGYVLLKPTLGEATALRYAGHRHLAAALAVGFVIGFYDGALGPGTGSFLVFSLVGLLGYSFLEASAKARLANWATNLGALALFVPQGAVLWKVGLVMGGCNLVGGYVGARVAVSRGARFVRVFFIVVVSAFIVRIGGDVAGLW